MAQPFRHPSSGIYYLRRRVPEALQSLLGREYKRSLATKDASEAKRAFAAAWVESEALFASARAQLEGTAQLTAKDIQKLAASWFHKELDEMERTGEFSPLLLIDRTYVDPHGDVEREDISTLRQYADEHPRDDWKADVLPKINQTLREHRLPPVPQTSPVFPSLLAAFREHLFKLSDLAFLRHSGNWTATADVLPSAPVQPEHRIQTTAKGLHLSTLFQQYSNDKLLTDGDNRSNRKTLDEYRSTITRFTELFGDLPVPAINRQVVQEFRQALAQMPSSGKDIRKLNARQQIAKAQSEKLPTLTAATIRKQLKSLSSVLGFAAQLGIINENPVSASGVTKRLAKATAKAPGALRRKDYNLDELRRIFSGPVHAGGWSAEKDAALFWLPLLMYYTGARREELAQLSARDVIATKVEPPYLSILATPDESDEDRTVKTQGSRRTVPLHEDLVTLGFLDYARGLPQDGQLFPRLKPNPAGWYGHNFGKRWAKYLRDTLHLNSPASPSHGFRHTFKTMCRQAGIPEEVHDAITGHSDGSVSRAYGSMPLRRMAEELTKLQGITQETAT